MEIIIRVRNSLTISLFNRIQSPISQRKSHTSLTSSEESCRAPRGIKAMVEQQATIKIQMIFTEISNNPQQITSKYFTHQVTEVKVAVVRPKSSRHIMSLNPKHSLCLTRDFSKKANHIRGKTIIRALRISPISNSRTISLSITGSNNTNPSSSFYPRGTTRRRTNKTSIKRSHLSITTLTSTPKIWTIFIGSPKMA